MKMTQLVLIAAMTLSSAASFAKNYSAETQEKINAARGYAVALQMADPVLMHTKGFVRNVNVLKVEEINDFKVKVTVQYEFNDNVNGHKLITDVVVVLDAHDISSSERLGQTYNTGHLIAIEHRSEKEIK